MTKREHKTKLSAVESLVSKDRDLMKALLRETLQEVLEGEMTSFWALPPASAPTAATVIGPATTAAAGSPASASSSCGCRATATANSPPRCSSLPAQ